MIQPNSKQFDLAQSLLNELNANLPQINKYIRQLATVQNPKQAWAVLASLIDAPEEFQQLFHPQPSDKPEFVEIDLNNLTDSSEDSP